MAESIIISNIKHLCDKNNLTVSLLEKKLDFSSGLISRWNKSSPTIDKIITICDYFDVSVDYVLGRTNRDIIKTTEDIFLNKLLQDTKAYLINWIDAYEINKNNKQNIFDENTITMSIVHLCNISFIGGQIISCFYFEYFSSIVYCVSYTTKSVEEKPPIHHSVFIQVNKSNMSYINNTYLISDDTEDCNVLNDLVERYLSTKDVREKACSIMNNFINNNNE
jgi:transcriptional regulator with XRE-family HTH domain